MKKIFNKIGFTCIEAIPAILALIVCIAGLVDIVVILKKINTISTTATYVARTVGVQGGVRDKAPAYYIGCSETLDSETCKYTNTETLYNDVKNMLSGIDLDESNWDLTISACDKNGLNCKETLLEPDSRNIKADYGEYLNVNLEITYDWAFMKTVLPVSPTYNKTSSRMIMSTFKIREG